MKALVIDRPGAFKNLYLTDLPLPVPGPDEVRVKVAAVGLNPVDYKLLLGGHPAWEFPFVPGLDVAGVIDAVGTGVQQWSPGDRVVYHGQLSRPGGLAEYAITRAHVVGAIPDAVTFEQAAALPCAGMTAYQAIDRRLNLKAGSVILVQAGAGGVGGFAVQLAAERGATVFTTCSPENNAYVKQLGAAEAIDYHTTDVTARIMELTAGRGVDAVIDVVGKAAATEAIGMLAFGGALVCIESLPDFSQWNMGLSLHGIVLGGAHFSNNRRAQEDLGVMVEELCALVAEGRLDPMVSETIPLDGVADALQRLAARHVRGKIVTQIS